MLEIHGLKNLNWLENEKYIGMGKNKNCFGLIYSMVLRKMGIVAILQGFKAIIQVYLGQ
jgi:hypothetical protein